MSYSASSCIINEDKAKKFVGLRLMTALITSSCNFVLKLSNPKCFFKACFKVVVIFCGSGWTSYKPLRTTSHADDVGSGAGARAVAALTGSMFLIVLQIHVID